MGKGVLFKRALHKNITFNDEILNDFLACRYVFIYQSRVADCPQGLCSGRGLEHAHCANLQNNVMCGSKSHLGKT